MFLGLALGMAAAGCDPRGDDEDGGGSEQGQTTGGMESGGTGDAGVCELVPEQGPALLDFGRCVAMATGRVLGSCGNTGVNRRCDAAYLQWCNDQGGDVEVCDERQTLAVTPFVPCGTGPNAITCDLPFKDNCDSLDGEVVCYDDACQVGGCALPPTLQPIYVCCDSASPDGKSGKGCTGYDPEEAGCTKTIIYCPGGFSFDVNSGEFVCH